LVGNPEQKVPFGRPMYRWEDNIKMDHSEIRTESVDWVYLAAELL
jgi:hypothetical protein